MARGAARRAGGLRPAERRHRLQCARRRGFIRVTVRAIVRAASPSRHGSPVHASRLGPHRGIIRVTVRVIVRATVRVIIRATVRVAVRVARPSRSRTAGMTGRNCERYARGCCERRYRGDIAGDIAEISRRHSRRYSPEILAGDIRGRYSREISRSYPGGHCVRIRARARRTLLVRHQVCDVDQ